jgi:hypothetical protein
MKIKIVAIVAVILIATMSTPVFAATPTKQQQNFSTGFVRATKIDSHKDVFVNSVKRLQDSSSSYIVVNVRYIIHDDYEGISVNLTRSQFWMCGSNGVCYHPIIPSMKYRTARDLHLIDGRYVNNNRYGSRNGRLEIEGNVWFRGYRGVSVRSIGYQELIKGRWKNFSLDFAR